MVCQGLEKILEKPTLNTAMLLVSRCRPKLPADVRHKSWALFLQGHHFQNCLHCLQLQASVKVIHQATAPLGAAQTKQARPLPWAWPTAVHEAKSKRTAAKLQAAASAAGSTTALGQSKAAGHRCREQTRVASSSFGNKATGPA